MREAADHADSRDEWMRLFVAVEIPDAIKQFVRAAQDQLRRLLYRADVSWTHEDQWHLTLKFFGNVEAARVPDLASRLSEACSQIAPFLLALDCCGQFPVSGSPRVIWLGVNGAIDSLRFLQERIEQSLEGFGDNKESKRETFHPHITLGRVKRERIPSRVISAAFASVAKIQNTQWNCDEVRLIRSIPRDRRHEYVCLRTVALHSVRA